MNFPVSVTQKQDDLDIQSLVNSKKGKMSDEALLLILSLLLESLIGNIKKKGDQEQSKIPSDLDKLMPKITSKDGKMYITSYEDGKKIETEIKKIDDSQETNGFQ